ncbi:rCG54768, isoform CRA_c [Rattus norvegicus]|uniref:RCG54768, isoform CRA_c n=1 Tax=Rattus norvegicus TaxID=10116 RepID=A6IJ80_RAT|nr:rCG54768, isoform CRA_c [Rattus norvegicus]
MFAAAGLVKPARLMKVFVTGPLPAQGRAALAQATESGHCSTTETIWCPEISLHGAPAQASGSSRVSGRVCAYCSAGCRVRLHCSVLLLNTGYQGALQQGLLPEDEEHCCLHQHQQRRCGKPGRPVPGISQWSDCSSRTGCDHPRTTASKPPPADPQELRDPAPHRQCHLQNSQHHVLAGG